MAQQTPIVSRDGWRVIARDLIGPDKTNIYDALGLARRVIYCSHSLDEANRNNYVALPCTAGHYFTRSVAQLGWKRQCPFAILHRFSRRSKPRNLLACL